MRLSQPLRSCSSREKQETEFAQKLSDVIFGKIVSFFDNYYLALVSRSWLQHFVSKHVRRVRYPKWCCFVHIPSFGNLILRPPRIQSAKETRKQRIKLSDGIIQKLSTKRKYEREIQWCRHNLISSAAIVLTIHLTNLYSNKITSILAPGFQAYTKLSVTDTELERIVTKDLKALEEATQGKPEELPRTELYGPNLARF